MRINGDCESSKPFFFAYWRSDSLSNNIFNAVALMIMPCLCRVYIEF